MSSETKNENPGSLPGFFDKYPEIKAKIVEYLNSVPQEEKEKNLEEFNKYISGELTWGEIHKISKPMQKELARVAYLKFRLKNYVRAESIFKMLALVDHTNWYYRAALGAVYQKQNKYEEAISEYGIAIELKEDEWSCLVNRGECYIMIKDFESAKEDFKKVAEAEIPANNPWKIRAMALQQRVSLVEREDSYAE